MKLCNINLNNTVTGCVVTEKGLVPFEKLGFCGTVQDLIQAEKEVLCGLQTAAAEYEGEFINPGTVSWENVTKPGKLLCVGLNYKKHAEETGGEAPETPVYFSKFNDCLCPNGQEVTLPEWHRCYDYEGELVIVIGKTIWHISDEEAERAIFGYTVGNDLSARDCQFLSNQWLAGKAMPDFAPAGPVVVTADSFNPEEPKRITTRVNGETRQEDETTGMIFTCRQIVADASKYFKLQPGDLIFTGTPSGVILGYPKGRRVWLKKGDIAEVEIEGIGTLKNRFI